MSTFFIVFLFFTPFFSLAMESKAKKKEVAVRADVQNKKVKKTKSSLNTRIYAALKEANKLHKQQIELQKHALIYQRQSLQLEIAMAKLEFNNYPPLANRYKELGVIADPVELPFAIPRHSSSE